MACLRRSLVFKSVILSSNLQFRYFESTMWLPQILCLFRELCNFRYFESTKSGCAEFFWICLLWPVVFGARLVIQSRSFEFTRSSCAEFLWFFTILLNTHTHNNNHVPCFVRKRTGVDSVVIFLSGFCRKVSQFILQGCMNVGCIIGSEPVCQNWRAARLENSLCCQSFKESSAVSAQSSFLFVTSFGESSLFERGHFF